MHFIYPRQWTKRRASVMKNDHPPFVLALDDASATLDTVGGKGASLARMAAAGLPVPPGFHITTAAYRHFVAANELQRAILAAVAATKADDPATLEEAARQIGRLFAQRAMPDEIAEAIGLAYAALGGGDLHRRGLKEKGGKKARHRPDVRK